MNEILYFKDVEIKKWTKKRCRNKEMDKQKGQSDYELQFYLRSQTIMKRVQERIKTKTKRLKIIN